MKERLWIGLFSRDFEDHFLKTLAQSIAAYPLEPHVVLVGSNLLGIHLRHALAQKTQGHLHLRFLTFVDLAKALMQQKLQMRGCRPFPKDAEELLISNLCSDLPSSSVFSSVKDQNGFHKALRSTFHDLTDAGIKKAEPSELKSKKLKELFSLYAAHQNLYTSSFYSTADLILEASNEGDSFSSVFHTSKLFVYGFYDLTDIQKYLLNHCSKTTNILAWVPIPKTPPAFVQKTLTFFQNLTQDGKKLPASKPAKISAFSAPESYREAEETVRWILKKHEEQRLPLHQVGILLRHPKTYIPLFSEVLNRAHIPYYQEGGTTLESTRTGKAMLRLLDLLGKEWTRAEMIEVLTLFPFDQDLYAKAGTPADWDEWSRKALVVGGKKNFIVRLHAYQEELKKKKFKNVTLLSAFLTFLQNWFDTLEAIENANSWTDLGLKLTKCLERFAQANDSVERVMEVCQGLLDLENPLISSHFSVFQRILKKRIQDAKISGSTFERDGLFLGSLVSARAISFELVCMPGLVEREFPSPPIADPLLLDPERKELNQRFQCGLRLSETQLEQERVLFGLGLHQAGSNALISHSRLSAADHREKLPSPFFTQLVEDCGIKIHRHSLLRWVDKPRTPVLDESEWLTFEMAQGIFTNRESYWNALLELSTTGPYVDQWIEERLGTPTWGSYDGLVKRERGSEKQSPTYSAKELVDYVTCPYQYFLRYVIGLKRLDRPDEVYELRPLDRGNLIHEILFALFTWLREKNFFPLKQKDRNQIHEKLKEISHNVFSEMENKAPLRAKALWDTEKEFMLSDLRLLVDTEIRESSFFKPQAFEVRFGMPSFSDQEDQTLSTEEKIPVNLGREKIFLRGKIDRIDLSPDEKRARVIDYKTGSIQKFKNDQFIQGKALQLPVYLSALSTLLPKVQTEASEALLMSTAFGSGFARITFSGTTLRARKKDFLKILSTIQDGQRKGIYIPKPGKNMENCRICDFQSVCGQSIGRLYERKAKDSLTEPLLSLEEVS